MPVQITCVEGQFRPVVICDHCQEAIGDAKDGDYEWRVEDGQVKTGGIFFTHKRCCRAFELANGGRPGWMCAELRCLPLFLGRNLNLDWDDAEETARRFAEII